METIICNGKVWLGGNTFAQAVAIHEGKIAAIGTDTEIIALQTPTTNVINANGQLLLPGMNDSHFHLQMLGRFLSSIVLYGVPSIAELIKRGQNFLQENQLKPNEVIIGMGWNQDDFVGADKGKMPTRHDLDQISTEYPLIFKRSCLHMLVCNTKALELAGVDATTPQVPNGVFEVDETGYPNGVFKEDAQTLIRVLEPVPDVALIKENIKKAIDHVLAQGVTSVQVNDLSERYPEYPFILQAYNELKDAGELPLHVYLQCGFTELQTFRDFIAAGYYTGYGDNRFKIGPLKLFADGSLGARTALLRTAYHDDPSTTGEEAISIELMQEFVTLAHNNKFQVIIHAIGDAAIERVVNAYTTLDDKENKLRHGVNHCQITDMALIQRFKDHNLLAYLQPIFLTTDWRIVADRVGAELASTSYAFKTFEDLGITTAYSTDAPVEGINPFHCLYCAITRKDLQGKPPTGYYPEQAVDITTALTRYTTGSAYAAFEESIKGTIEIGKLADLILVNQDLFTIQLEQIKDTTVVWTMVEGEIVYQQG